MLGFHISIYRQKNPKTHPASFQTPTGARLLVWQTGIQGIDWLQELVKSKRAVSLGGNGYPIRYTAPKKELSSYMSKPPYANAAWQSDEGDVLSASWEGKTTKNQKDFDLCAENEWLIIEAWDES
jgi:hypothetical protein